MIKFGLKRGKLVNITYAPELSDATYSLNWVLDTPFRKAFETLAKDGDTEAATVFWKLAFTVAVRGRWNRAAAGAWTVEFAGHLVLCENDRETGLVVSKILRENPNATLPAEAITDAAVLAYYYRRHQYRMQQLRGQRKASQRAQSR